MFRHFSGISRDFWAENIEFVWLQEKYLCDIHPPTPRPPSVPEASPLVHPDAWDSQTQATMTSNMDLYME